MVVSVIVRKRTMIMVMMMMEMVMIINKLVIFISLL